MRSLGILALLFLLLCSIGNAQTGLPASNPFAAPSKLPYQAPPFDQIKDSDYKPAIEEGLRQRLAEVDKIANNPAAPTFKNTLVAFEKTGQLFTRVNNVFNAVSGANTNDALQQLQEEMASKISANHDAIYLNAKLFARIKSVYERRATLKLSAEDKRLLDVTYLNFVLAGANLSDADKLKLQKLNEEDATLSARFSNQLVNANKNGGFVVKKESELDGLSASDKAAFAENAKAKGLAGQWLLPLKNTTQQPALQSLTDRSVRQRLFEASWTRAERSDSNDTRATILRLASLRAERAALLGYTSYAAWKLQDQMAKTPEAVDQFFARLVPLLLEKTGAEAAALKAQMQAQNAGSDIKPWDWDFYGEQVRKAKYDLDEAEVKPYFELNKVLTNGVFYAATQLYGLRFKERHDIPVYNPDVRVFEVFDTNGKSFALFYADYFKRDNKSGGAWMNNLVDQSYLLGTKPVIANTCNFTKPAPGQPALISFDDVTTMFHEFGHALHGLFANQRYLTLSGTNTARDFVEFPSQFNEHWAMNPKILKHYAVHYQTGKPIPPALLDKIMKASSFRAGYALTEAVEAAKLDLQWHALAPGRAIADVDAFELEALKSTGLDLLQVPPRYRSSYFLHIWGNGYAAGYYAYQWTKMLSEDAFSWFEEHGGLTRANGDRFRRMILSRGNTKDYTAMFKAFRGHEPDIKPMQKALGLKK
ncbi:MAG: peptidyl-dipeptidase Dcp [Bacteroidota bacterium]